MEWGLGDLLSLVEKGRDALNLGGAQHEGSDSGGTLSPTATQPQAQATSNSPNWLLIGGIGVGVVLLVVVVLMVRR